MLKHIGSRSIRTSVIGREIVFLPEVDSTNSYLKRAAWDGAPEGLVVVADYQTAGRGRQGRLFQSPSGKGLYFSALLRPQLPAERLLPVTALAAVAVCRAVESICEVRLGIKWPNDLVLDHRKLAGILTEQMTDRKGNVCVVLGIGINVFQAETDFSPDVAAMATSLQAVLGKTVSRERLAAEMLRELDRMYDTLKQGDLSDYLERYRRDCMNLGKSVQLFHPNGSVELAEAENVDEQFGLVVRTEKGYQTICSGEVSVRGLYGYVE